MTQIEQIAADNNFLNNINLWSSAQSAHYLQTLYTIVINNSPFLFIDKIPVFVYEPLPYFYSDCIVF